MAETNERESRQPIEHRQAATKAAVFVPVFKQSIDSDRHEGGAALRLRSDASRLEEAVGLAAAIGLDIRASAVVNAPRPKPATLVGSGKVSEMKEVVANEDITLVVFDHPLTPVQQRNLETELGAKVLDRTGLILEIFGERARTKEGRLQVELAHLNYQRGRLVRSWTHLERQRGGAGFLGGPGETQIEADRRQLQDKIKRLEKELDQVKRTRSLHRAQRKKAPDPVVALVGYTNAGKSTLFNSLTGAGAFAENLLFATLDPTLRRLPLPHGTTVMLSDTVGFVSDLPTHLVAAFRATLEEVIEADLILHVRDISDPDTHAQSEDVKRILQDLGIQPDDETRVVEVWNKIDRLDEAGLHHIETARIGPSDPTAVHLVSAVEKRGLRELTLDIEARIAGRLRKLTVTVGARSLSLIAFVYENATVSSRNDGDDGSVSLEIEMTAQAETALRRQADTMPEVSID